MPPPVPKHKIADIWENGKSREVITVKKKKMGRPTDDPKTITKRARMSEEDVKKLKICCEKLKKTESDIIRMGIGMVYQKLEK